MSRTSWDIFTYRSASELIWFVLTDFKAKVLG